MSAPHYALRTTHYALRLAPPLLLIGLICLLAWRVQYAVDQEVSLLPWLMARGWVLYRDMVDQHPPLLPLLLSVLGAGDPGLPLHLVIIGLLAIALGLVYALAAQLAGRLAGLGAVLLAAVWGLPFDTLHLWYDGALAPIYLAVGCLACFPRLSPPIGEAGAGGADSSAGGAARRGARSSVRMVMRALVIGLLLGLGLLFKQHAVVAVPFVGTGVVLWGRDGVWQRIGAYALGVAVPVAVAGGWLWGQGAAGDAWYWAVAYNLNGSYVAAANLPIPAGEWGPMLALYLPAVALALAGAWFGSRGTSQERWPLVVRGLVLGGLLLAATLPIWPRYARYHLQAALPLLAVAAVVAAVRLGEAWRVGLGGRLAGGAGLVLLAGYTLAGGALAAQALGFVLLSEPAAAPYAATLLPLRACVDAHAPPGAPIFLYGLDSMLYRVLGREPTRPWAPQLSWIMASGDIQPKWWAGMEAARPPVALVSASGWDGSPTPSMDTGEGRMRYNYHEVGRYPLAVYPGAPPYAVVCLVRSDNANR